MAEYTGRRLCMNINGLLGGLIATLLLLSILGGLTYLAIQVQAANATTYYQIVDEQNIPMTSTDTEAKHYKIVK
jgi:hypothetical protein